MEAQNRQWASAGGTVGIPSVWQLRGIPSLEIDLQSREAVSLGCGYILLHQISHMDYTPK